MRIIRTEHISEYDDRMKYRYVETKPPHPDAILQFTEWPDDPKIQPVRLTWLIEDINIEDPTPAQRVLPKEWLAGAAEARRKAMGR